MTLAIPLRAIYGLEDFITMRHLQNMAKVILATGLIVAYGYVMEAFMAWYSGNPYEDYMILNRLFGPYAPLYWACSLCNVVVPQALWFSRVRTNVQALFVVAMVSTSACGWSALSSLSPACIATFCPRRGACTTRRYGTGPLYVGTIGLFFALLFLFIRFLPMISIFEMRELVSEMDGTERAQIRTCRRAL